MKYIVTVTKYTDSRADITVTADNPREACITAEAIATVHLFPKDLHPEYEAEEIGEVRVERFGEVITARPARPRSVQRADLDKERLESVNYSKEDVLNAEGEGEV